MHNYTERIRYFCTYKLWHEHALIAAHIPSNSLTRAGISIKTIWMEMCASRKRQNLIKQSFWVFIYIMKNLRWQKESRESDLDQD